MNKKVYLPALLFSIMVLMGCSGCNNSDTYGSENRYIRTDGNKFIDPGGRHILLHGVNLVNKDPENNYLGNETPEIFTDFHFAGKLNSRHKNSKK